MHAETLQQQLATAYTEKFVKGEQFDTILEARKLAESILGEKVDPGTLTAKLVDESVEQGVVQAARELISRTDTPLRAWEQCLDLYARQPTLNTRTSTSALQQAYSTPIPIAYLAAQLADINQQTTVYEPTAGNGALILLADPTKAVVNELNPSRAGALRAQGFAVTEQDASIFLPQVPPVDRVICNPPFGSVKDEIGQPRIFRHGLLTTTQIDHAIALKALDLMKPDGKAVLILGGKIGDEESRTQRYNTQLSRGFYRWLYKDAGYKVTDHFSIDGSLYRKQGTSFPIDVILIEGRGGTRLKLPGVQSPRIYESYEALEEVLVNVHQQRQLIKPEREPRITLQQVHTGLPLDAGVLEYRGVSPSLDNSASTSTNRADREPTGVSPSINAPGRMADRASDRGLVENIRASRGTGSSSVGSQPDNGVLADVPEQSFTPTNSPTNGGILGDELPRTTGAVLPGSGIAVPSQSQFIPGAELQISRGYEPDRLASLDERGHESTQFSRLDAMPNTESEILEQEVALENQISYQPRSRAFSLNTLIPAAALKGLENAFNKVEATTGLSIDEYVRTRLDEPSLETLFQHYAAEQIDSLALAIYNYEYEQKATLIGHDTGIGKTRIVCGLSRYAQQQGLIPTIVTADPVLYGDILARDAVDTGNRFNPLITNNGMRIVLKSSTGEEIGEITTPKNQIEKITEYAQTGGIGEHDCVFTTYGQLTGSTSVERRKLLNALAPRMFLILDESHKAGGAAGEQKPETKAERARKASDDYVVSCTEFFQELVTKVPGFVASSATAIKDPIVAARLFYHTTDLKLAAPDRETFTEHLKAGGVPLQQQVFAMWVESGGVIRCEKSYEGVEFGIQKVPVSLQTAENNARILNLIWQFDRLKKGVVEGINRDLAEAGEAARDKNPALGDAGATSINFTSVLHNLAAVTSLGLKVEETANAVIQDIEQGRKPIVMLFNTMESSIKNFIETHNELAATHNAEFPDSPMRRIEVGDAIAINAGELFKRYLEKSRTIKVTEPYLDPTTGRQKSHSHRLSDAELGEAATAAYVRAAQALAEADWSQLPISPIDYLKQKVEDAGYSIGEITGRTHILKYESANDLRKGVVTYSTRDHSTSQKKQVMDDFQNGRIDAIITNSTTGYSLHAARTVADQRQRCMYIVQPHLDINQVEQSIGRSHRSGQVDPAKHAPDRLDEQGQPMWGQYPGQFGLPVFKLVVGQDLPTEERAVAIMMKKMAHLKANTTGNRTSSFGLKELPDFLNDYGNEVAAKLMEENSRLHADLDHPLGIAETLDREKAIQKVTGRAVMLTSDEAPTLAKPYPSLARQAWLYDTLSSEYKEYLAQKIALGENNLEAQKLDLQAEPKRRLVLNPGEPEIDSPFTKPAYLVEVKAKTGAKPNTTLQVVNAVRQELGFESLTDLLDHDEYERSDVKEKGREIAQQTIDQLRESTSEFLAIHVRNKEAELTTGNGRIAKYQNKFDTQSAIKGELEQRLAGAEQNADIQLIAQLKAQLQQQQPKLDKLQQQVNKARQDLNSKLFQFDKDERLIKGSLEDVSILLKRFPIGQGVRLVDYATNNLLYGVVVGVERLNRANNPASRNNWKLNLLVVDGVRSLSIRLDSLIGKVRKQGLEPVETVPSFADFQRESSIYQLFDERQTEAKEKRYVVSGQVLAAKLTGKFAQVTDEHGRIHPVYLLKRGFDPEKDLDKNPIKLQEPELINQFLFEKTKKVGIIQTDDEHLTITAHLNPRHEGSLILKTSKSTAQGGKYFKDEGLIQLTGDFVSRTESIYQNGKTTSQSVMVVTVPVEKSNEVLNYIAKKWTIGAASHKDAARELLGQPLPAWEPCKEINPDVKCAIAPRLSSRVLPALTPPPNEAQQTPLSSISVENAIQSLATTHQQKERVTASPSSVANSRDDPLHVIEQKGKEKLGRSVDKLQAPELREVAFKDAIQLNLWQVEPTPLKSSSPRKRSTHKLPQSQELEVEQLSLFYSQDNVTVLSPKLEDSNHTAKQELNNTSELQEAILSELNQLEDKGLLLLRQRVTDYLVAEPVLPPSLSQQLVVREEIERLSGQISNLWQEQAKQVKEVESMQRRLFGTWNKNYEKTVENLNQTMSKISQLIVQKDSKENQIRQWAEQSHVHQIWKAEPRTIQMKEMANMLKHPQIQERLTQAQQRKVEQQKELQHRIVNDQDNKQQRGRPRL